MFKRSFLGQILIISGLFIILLDTDLFNYYEISHYLNLSHSWPFIPFIFALYLWFSFFRNKNNYELLMPASVLTTISIIFMAMNYLNINMHYLWPFFIVGPAIGLWLMQLSPYKTKDYKASAFILSTVSIFLLSRNVFYVDFRVLFGALILIIGIILLINRK